MIVSLFSVLLCTSLFCDAFFNQNFLAKSHQKSVQSAKWTAQVYPGARVQYRSYVKVLLALYCLVTR